MKKLLTVVVALACASLYVGCSCDCEVCAEDPLLGGQFCVTEEDYDKKDCEELDGTSDEMGVKVSAKCK